MAVNIHITIIELNALHTKRQNLFQELDAVIHLLMEAKHWGLRKSRNATSLNSRFKRSEERRVGKECRYRWPPTNERKKTKSIVSVVQTATSQTKCSHPSELSRSAIMVERATRELRKFAKLATNSVACVPNVSSRKKFAFFFSSRRRHTRSVSAFLLNRSSDLRLSICLWKPSIGD